MKAATVQLPITPALSEALDEVLPCGGGDAPTAVTGWPAPGRHWRKIVAVYPNGWRLVVHFRRTGEISSARCTLNTRITGPRGSAAEQE